MTFFPPHMLSVPGPADSFVFFGVDKGGVAARLPPAEFPSVPCSGRRREDPLSNFFVENYTFFSSRRGLPRRAAPLPPLPFLHTDNNSSACPLFLLSLIDDNLLPLPEVPPSAVRWALRERLVAEEFDHKPPRPTLNLLTRKVTPSFSPFIVFFS